MVPLLKTPSLLIFHQFSSFSRPSPSFKAFLTSSNNRHQWTH